MGSDETCLHAFTTQLKNTTACRWKEYGKNTRLEDTGGRSERHRLGVGNYSGPVMESKRANATRQG